MSHLIPLTDREGVPAVNARDLHRFLESKQEFANWIKNRIHSYGFVIGEDFTTIDKKINRQVLTEYTISLDMAKELSMVERNEKGKEARKYFIECEKQANGVSQSPPTHLETAKLLVSTLERNERLELKVTEDAPKVEFYERVTESKSVCQMAVAAQVAKLPFGRNILFRELRKMGVLLSGGKRHNLPKQSYINQGLFSVEESSYTSKETQETFVSFTTHVTQKGIDWLIKSFDKASKSPQANS